VTLGPDGLLQGAPRGRIFIDVSTQLPKTAHWERGLDAGKGPISRVLRCTARRAR
jgi:3-hydroxyisobutyrate dehydrogenase-like beta-hydroxyacid dehydrogenase